MRGKHLLPLQQFSKAERSQLNRHPGGPRAPTLRGALSSRSAGALAAKPACEKSPAGSWKKCSPTNSEETAQAISSARL